MKAKCFETNEVELKPGDKVIVYVTTTWGGPWATASTTHRHGVGFVVRVYRHIDSVVVRFSKSTNGTQFFRQGDSRYSVWRAS